jgi:hypothetical protein
MTITATTRTPTDREMAMGTAELSETNNVLLAVELHMS